MLDFAGFNVDWLDEDLNSTNAVSRKRRKKGSIKKYPTISHIEVVDNSKFGSDRSINQKLDKSNQTYRQSLRRDSVPQAETPPLLKGVKLLTRAIDPESNPLATNDRSNATESVFPADFTLLLKPPPSLTDKKPDDQKIACPAKFGPGSSADCGTVLDLSDDSFLNSPSFLTNIDKIVREKLAASQATTRSQRCKVESGLNPCKATVSNDLGKNCKAKDAPQSQCKPNLALNGIKQSQCKPILSDDNKRYQFKPTAPNGSEQYQCKPAASNAITRQFQSKPIASNDNRQFQCKPTVSNNNRQFRCKLTSNDDSHFQCKPTVSNAKPTTAKECQCKPNSNKCQCKPIASDDNKQQYECKPIALKQDVVKNRTPTTRRVNVLHQNSFDAKWDDDSPFNKPSFIAQLNEICATNRPKADQNQTIVLDSQISQPMDASTPITSGRIISRRAKLFNFHKQRLWLDDDDDVIECKATVGSNQRSTPTTTGSAWSEEL